MALVTLNSPVPNGGWRPAQAGFGHRWQGRVLTGAGLALLPWSVCLAATLPPRQAAAWITLDLLEAAALLTAGARLRRGTPGHRAAAAAAAALLAVDAVVDVATATGQDLATALAMALAAELPLAALCTRLAIRPAAADGR
ncbi:hypothetical protein [Streptomyces pinistramenti]|uniref:hypothetical protein n=1 Tax=Streptomyces pinistramenti TaxID=2884812 RepID=UPI001D08711E|nr:hypothetical protein [Streptomyces pinistramenti]MCB5906829.1 hypothetical protein [Streptomyces pinistramenti]